MENKSYLPVKLTKTEKRILDMARNKLGLTTKDVVVALNYLRRTKNIDSKHFIKIVQKIAREFYPPSPPYQRAYGEWLLGAVAKVQKLKNRVNQKPKKRKCPVFFLKRKKRRNLP